MSFEVTGSRKYRPERPCSELRLYPKGLEEPWKKQKQYVHNGIFENTPNNLSICIYSMYSLPCTIFTTIYESTLIILTMTLRDGYYYYFSHFMGEKTDS